VANRCHVRADEIDAVEVEWEEARSARVSGQIVKDLRCLRSSCATLDKKVERAYADKLQACVDAWPSAGPRGRSEPRSPRADWQEIYGCLRGARGLLERTPRCRDRALARPAGRAWRDNRQAAALRNLVVSTRKKKSRTLDWPVTSTTAGTA